MHVSAHRTEDVKSSTLHVPCLLLHVCRCSHNFVAPHPKLRIRADSAAAAARRSLSLFVERSDRVKLLIDGFRQARALRPRGAPAMELTHPFWCAPEVLQGGEGSRAADVYSFGIVLWEMLTWELPYKEVGIHPWMVRWQRNAMLC